MSLSSSKSSKRPKNFWDLTEEARDDDCAWIFTHPIAVFLTVLIGILLFAWGMWLAIRYWIGREKDIGRLWWQTSATFVAVTLLNITIPYRLRFAWNVYAVIFCLLMVQNAAFTLIFPLQTVGVQSSPEKLQGKE